MIAYIYLSLKYLFDLIELYRRYIADSMRSREYGSCI